LNEHFQENLIAGAEAPYAYSLKKPLTEARSSWRTRRNCVSFCPVINCDG